jgi:EAL domain-containing protein (putative c-di-GMP-specific phosphodiesterase class I)
MDAGIHPGTVAVNLSPYQFRRPDIVETIGLIIDRCEVNGKYLELELTESTLVEDVEEAIKTLEFFKEKGVSIAIDDFGTSYSSLSYLKRFPIDKLKTPSWTRDSDEVRPPVTRPRRGHPGIRARSKV